MNSSQIFEQFSAALGDRVSIVDGVHGLMSRVFRLRGFRWELRQHEGIKFGLWRKDFRKNRKRSDPPRRLVFLPGFGDTPLSWLAVFLLIWPIIKKQYDEVVLVTFPGFAGFLQNEKSFRSMDQLIEATTELCADLRPHTVMGHSMGGFLASHYASACGAERSPELLILVDPSGVGETETEKQKLQGVLHSIGREGFKVLRPHAFAKEPFWFPLVARDFAKCIEFEEVSQLALSFRPDHWVQDRLHKIRSKVWVIWGEKDSLLPSNHVHIWLEALRSAQSPHAPKGVFLKNLGHSPQVENPAVTAAVVSQILLKREPYSLGKRWWRIVSD